MTVAWWPGSRAPRGGQGPPWAGSVSSGAMGPPLCWRPWAVGPRVPRWPTSGLGRRLLRGSCAPSRRPAVLFPRGCSGFWRPSPLSPSLCLAASPRLPAGPVPRPGALVLLRPVAASHPCLPPPARRWCRVPTRGRSSRPTPCAPRSGARARARVGSRPSAVALAAARCLRWWLVWGGGGRAPARLPSPPPPRERGAGPPRPRAAIGAAPVCVLGGLEPSLASRRRRRCALVRGGGALASPPRSPLRAGEGRGEWGASSRSPPPRAPALRVGGALLPPPPPPPPPRVPLRARHVRPTGRPCAAPLLGGAGCLWLTALLPG